MSVKVRIQQQARKSLALRVTPEGLVALIPHGLDPDGPRVRCFIERGLERIPEPSPPSEPLRQAQGGLLTPQALRDLVAVWAQRIGVEVGRVCIREMRNKWASCSSRSTITLSRDLLQLPRDLVEYVVCHELVHLKIPGHGKGWQALMGICLPDWREREERLAGEGLVRPYALHQDLEAAYNQMAQDDKRESEALEWAEATVGDVSDEAR